MKPAPPVTNARTSALHPREPVLDQRAHPRQRVAEHPDLLPLGERARPVVDGDLQRPVALANELDHQFEVEVEAVTLEGQPVQAIPPEYLEHGERVAQRLPVEDVEQRQEERVSDV